MNEIIRLRLEIHIINCIAASIVLLGFGIGYNHWVANLEAKGRDKGYMGFIVALGCAVTILAGLFWTTGNLAITLVMFLAFASSGTPMIWGSIRRHVKEREERERARKLRKVIEQFVKEREPLSEAQQTLVEHLITGALEIRDGTELILLAAKQLHDPTYARPNGGPEEQQEVIDTIMKGLVKQDRRAMEAA